MTDQQGKGPSQGRAPRLVKALAEPFSRKRAGGALGVPERRKVRE